MDFELVWDVPKHCDWSNNRAALIVGYVNIQIANDAMLRLPTDYSTVHLYK